jgi:hypothetical protein
MKKLLFLFILSSISSISHAQVQDQRKAQAKQLQGITLKGNTATLLDGFTFKKIGRDANGKITGERIQVLSATGRTAAVTLVCDCSDHTGCGIFISKKIATCRGSCTGCEFHVE